LTYHGPCPPDGEYLYNFKLSALDSKLALAETESRRRVEEGMAGKILAEVELMGRYQMKLACQVWRSGISTRKTSLKTLSKEVANEVHGKLSHSRG
jgi:hypothetical protein